MCSFSIYKRTFIGFQALRCLERMPITLDEVLLICTGKSLSEALIFVSTNPQYDNRLFIELQVQHKKIPKSNMERTCYVQKLFLTIKIIFVHNMFSPCSAKRRASDKDIPVPNSKLMKGLNESTFIHDIGYVYVFIKVRKRSK